MRTILTILSLWLFQAKATTYYVKAAGGTGSGLNDANAWSFAKYKSMESSLTSNDAILFKSGETFYGQIVARPGVQYNRYGTGAQPIISGFTSLTSWTNVGTNLWEAAVSAGAQLNMVTVNGNVVEPGKFPNTGWLMIQQGGDSSLVTNTASPSTYAGGNMVIKKRQWVLEKVKIKTISGSTINYSNPSDPLTQYAFYPSVANCGFFFTDHPATLDLQNEWYYSNGVLRMYSTVNPSTLSVKAATINTLVNITGGASNVRFSTIDFQGANEDAFFVSGGSGNRIEYCGINYTGKKGINALFSTNLTVQNNTVTNTNWSGIDAILGSYQYILNNNVNNNGMLKSLCQNNNNANHGIWVNGNHNLIEGNILNNIGYCGIDMGGDYDTCRNNFIDNYCQIATDGGGIYMGSEPFGVGRVIENNVVLRGLGPSDGSEYPWSRLNDAFGIYLDESTAGVSVINNFAGLSNGGGTYLHMANNVSFSGNTFYGNTNCQAKFAEDAPNKTRMVNIEWTNNRLHSTSADDYAYIVYCVDNTSKFFSRAANNIISNPGNPNNLIWEIIDYGLVADYKMNLAQWKAKYENYETFSTGAPASFNSGSSQIQITYGGKYNVPLDGVYQGLDGTIYQAGTVVLQPFTGQALKRVSDFVPVVTKPVTIRGRIRF